MLHFIIIQIIMSHNLMLLTVQTNLEIDRKITPVNKKFLLNNLN